MIAFLHLLAACAPASDSSAVVVEGEVAVFGVEEGDCPVDGTTISVEVGSDRAIVSADACPPEGRCASFLMYRIESGASEWFGSCEPGSTYSIAWVVPA